ncbi:MAG: iron-sulfur cluster assembly accessory protein [Pseudomonadota bacterium]
MNSSEVNISKAQKPQISLSTTALAHVKKMLRKQACAGVRFFLKKAGCSGFMYKLELTDKINDDDVYMEVPDNLTFVIPQKWLPYLNGIQIDYVQEGLNQQFKFINPNESASCGCGESFTIDEDDTSTE